MKNTSKEAKNRIFTVEQANATLPLVGAITADLSHLSRQISERRRQLEYLMYDRQHDKDNPYDEELLQAEKDLQKEHQQVEQYTDELRQLGIAATDSENGLVEFPSEIEGRPAFLSWKLGEPEVRYWREKNAKMRVPLPGIDSTSSDDTGPPTDVN